MQVYSISKQNSIKKILFFLSITLFAYLPVSSFLFFLKNDAFNGYFPPKFFMSESIHSGHLPLWNPYINFGIPQYADMSSGYWSPVTWLMAATFGYDAYTFTLELLFYLFLGGIGFYKMMQLWTKNSFIQLLSGVAYMCCGYNVGHLQHFNWISGAAILPWCIWSYLMLIRNFTFRRTILCGLIFYIFFSSAHPGISISAVYFFGFLFMYLFLNKTERAQSTGTYFKSNAFLLLIIIMLSAGMIAAYLDFLPHFVRSEKLSIKNTLENPTGLTSWISCLLPLSITKNDLLYNTDISMRNVYFGLTPFIFLISALIKKKSGWQYFFLFNGIFFMLLSLGGIFKSAAHTYLPLIGYVRLNGEFRIFTILSFLIISGIEMEKYLSATNTDKSSSSAQTDSSIKSTQIIQTISALLLFITAICIFYGLYHSINNSQGILYIDNEILSNQSTGNSLKYIIDQISFSDTLWIQGSIQFVFILGIKYAISRYKWKLVGLITIGNLMLCCLMNIPYTGVGKASVSQVQRVLDKSPAGFPVPKLIPVNTYDTISTEEKGLVGDWSLYSKQPGVCREVPYPIRLKKMAEYFERNEKGETLNYLNEPFIFIQNKKTTDTLLLNSYLPEKINVTAKSNTPSSIVLQQSFYPHWFYQSNEGNKEVKKAGIGFMSAPVFRPTEEITFFFNPQYIKWTMLFSCIVFLASVISLIFLKTK